MELSLKLVAKLVSCELSIFFVIKSVEDLPEKFFFFEVNESADHVAKHLFLEKVLGFEMSTAHETLVYFLGGKVLVLRIFELEVGMRNNVCAADSLFRVHLETTVQYRNEVWRRVLVVVRHFFAPPTRPNLSIDL